jgi:hypothetical protein
VTRGFVGGQDRDPEAFYGWINLRSLRVMQAHLAVVFSNADTVASMHALFKEVIF